MSLDTFCREVSLLFRVGGGEEGYRMLCNKIEEDVDAVRTALSWVMVFPSERTVKIILETPELAPLLEEWITRVADDPACALEAAVYEHNRGMAETHLDSFMSGLCEPSRDGSLFHNEEFVMAYVSLLDAFDFGRALRSDGISLSIVQRFLEVAPQNFRHLIRNERLWNEMMGDSVTCTFLCERKWPFQVVDFYDDDLRRQVSMCIHLSLLDISEYDGWSDLFTQLTHMRRQLPVWVIERFIEDHGEDITLRDHLKHQVGCIDLFNQKRYRTVFGEAVLIINHHHKRARRSEYVQTVLCNLARTHGEAGMNMAIHILVCNHARFLISDFMNHIFSGDYSLVFTTLHEAITKGSPWSPLVMELLRSEHAHTDLEMLSKAMTTRNLRLIIDVALKLQLLPIDDVLGVLEPLPRARDIVVQKLNLHE